MIDLMNRVTNGGKGNRNAEPKAKMPHASYSSKGGFSAVSGTLATAECTDLNGSLPDLNASLPDFSNSDHDPYDLSECSNRSFNEISNNRIIAPRDSMPNRTRLSMNAINQLKFSKLDRLYGRDQEVKQLRDLYVQAKENSIRQFILISGTSGTGKSVLAEKLEPIVKKDGGFYLSGKFDQQQQDEPYSAISAAFAELMNSLLEYSDTKRNECGWKFSCDDIQKRLCETMDSDQIAMLTIIVPSLARVTGGDFLSSKPSSRRVSGSEMRSSIADTKSSLHYAFVQLITILTDFAPTVMILNDLQWADAASMELVQSLLLDRNLAGKGFVLAGSYRSEAVSSSDLLMTTIQELREISQNDSDSNLKVTDIVLGNLTQDQVNDMLCDLLSCDEEHCRPLSEIVYRKTLGNVFFVVHFLKSLTADYLLVFSIVSLKWAWDVERIQLMESATENVIDLMKDKMNKLPPQVCRTLPFVACLGASFRSSIFIMVVEHFNTTFSSRSLSKDDVEGEIYSPSDFLGVCQKAGFLFTNSKGDTIHWEHDKVQEAALSLANEEELMALRSRLGEVLLQNLSKDDLERSIFVVVSLLDMNTARGDPQKQVRFAELNLVAGTKAMKASASATAAAHLTSGIKCLPDDHWESNAGLSLELHLMAIEALYCIGQFEEMNQYCKEVFEFKKLPMLSKARAYNSHVLAMIAEGRFGEASHKCQQILAELDCRFPRCFKGLHTWAGTLRAKKFAKNQIENTSKQAIMTDAKQHWIMFLLDTLSQAAHQGHSKLHGLANLRGLQYTLKYGICDWAPPLLAVIGNTLVVGLGDFDGAQFYGEMAMSLFETANISQNALSRTSFITSYFVLPHRVASTTCRKIALQGYQAGMKGGDVQSAMWCVLSYLDISFYVSQNLQTLSADCQIYWQQMKSLKQERIVKYLECLWQLVLNVSSNAEDASVLNGTALNYEEYMSFAESTKSVQAIYYYDRYQIAAAFWSCDYDKVYSLVLKTDAHNGFYEKTFGGSFALYPLYFQCALSLLSLYHETKSNKYKRMAKFFSAKLNCWARKGNPNFKHYSLLVDAEMAEIKSHPKEAEILFKESVVFAGRRGFTNDQALANERMSEFFLRQGLRDDAKYHLNEAVKLYHQWGAFAKCEIIQKKHQTLMPSLPFEIEKTTTAPMSELLTVPPSAHFQQH